MPPYIAEQALAVVWWPSPTSPTSSTSSPSGFTQQQASLSTLSQTISNDSDSEEDVEGHVFSYQQSTFKLRQGGEMIAVYYEDFIGEADQVTRRQVNIAGSQTQNLILQWPCTLHRCPMSVVFAGNLCFCVVHTMFGDRCELHTKLRETIM